MRFTREFILANGVHPTGHLNLSLTEASALVRKLRNLGYAVRASFVPQNPAPSTLTPVRFSEEDIRAAGLADTPLNWVCQLEHDDAHTERYLGQVKALLGDGRDFGLRRVHADFSIGDPAARSYEDHILNLPAVSAAVQKALDQILSDAA